MRLSRSSILVPVPGRDHALLLQPLTRQAALLPLDVCEALRESSEGLTELDDEELQQLRDAGLLVDSGEDDQRLWLAAKAEHLDELARTPTQLVVVPSFACNLRCHTCHQDGIRPEGPPLISRETLEALFAYIEGFHLGDEPRPYLTLFGGEPLVDHPEHRDRVERVLDFARSHGLEVAVMTNGYELGRYLDLLTAGPIKEVQVSVEGPPSVHDARRPHAAGGGSFDRVVSGIQALLDANVPVLLRVVVDGENLESLPELATLIEMRGWLGLPESRFRTQVGRNHELFACAGRQDARQDARSIGPLELGARFRFLAEAHPELRRFHQPRFHGLGRLAEVGELPVAAFDGCPAAKKEWAFGPDGGIYGCTATVGDRHHRLGRYAPAVERDEAAIARLRARSSLRIEACRPCELAPLCGGGCASVAEREHRDTVAPDCRPVRELLGLGAAYYWDALEERLG